MNDGLSGTRCRLRYLPDIEEWWRSTAGPGDCGQPLILLGGPGSGKLDTVTRWARQRPDLPSLISDGGKLTGSYLAGLLPLVEHAITAAASAHPQLLTAHQQSLKRLLPWLARPEFTVPADLTNSSSSEERTRFYHHEYEDKLLHGLYEFLLEHHSHTPEGALLVIDNAHDLSPTVTRFLRIAIRRRQLLRHVHLVLLADADLPADLLAAGRVLRIDPADLAEAGQLLAGTPGGDRFTPRQVEELWLTAGGNPARLLTLGQVATGLPVDSYLSWQTWLDFYLDRLGPARRLELAQDFVAGHCADDDPLAVRNYTTLRESIRADLHAAQARQLAQTEGAAGRAHLIHHTRLGTRVEQLQALAPVGIRFQETGLYDTWFDVFSDYYIDPALRDLPDGQQLHNLVFVRMAFILYSLGLAQLSIPYLEFFYRRFPDSNLTPMALYSQSMTYGRYRVPVDLDRAEHYALLNLDKIDTIFADHPKWVYIKVFAENALAYIRARQGRFTEALELCQVGVRKMQDIYGDGTYRLHQSILVYNTAQVHELLGDVDAAEATYRQTIDLDPYYGEYWNDLGNLLANHDRGEEALSCYQQAIDLCPPYYEAHLNRAMARTSLGDLVGAEEDLTRVLELKPAEARAHLALGVLRIGQGRLQDARQALDRALYYDPGNGYALTNRALTRQGLGDRDGARADLDRAVAVAPRNSEAWNARALLRYADGRYRDSLEDLDRAIALTPDPDYQANRAVIAEQLARATPSQARQPNPAPTRG